MEMPVRGTLRDKTPYLIVRRVMVADAGIWLSVQDVMCRGKHRIREYFHLDSRVRAEKTGEGMRLTSGEVCLNAVSPEPFKTEECLISRRYNEKSETLVLVKECEMEDRLTFSALFLESALTGDSFSGTGVCIRLWGTGIRPKGDRLGHLHGKGREMDTACMEQGDLPGRENVPLPWGSCLWKGGSA